MKKILFFAFFTLISLSGIFIYQYYRFHDGKLHVIFCDVGQGDGILIRTPSNKQILIDAGPDRIILDCLSRHMPFWDRKIELALLTHPHADHFMGYYFVIDRYRIDQFSTEELKNKSDGFTQLEDQLRQHKIATKYVYAEDRWFIPVIARSEATKQSIGGEDRHDPLSGSRDDVVIEIVAPTKDFLFGKNPDGFITNSAESASLITKVSYGNFAVLLTGDAPADEMREIAGEGVEGLDVLQIPHHGSTTGLDEHVIDLLAPQVAVISVGKNSYGHPKKKTLDLLESRGVKILRTDQLGDIELVSDGKELNLIRLN